MSDPPCSFCDLEFFFAVKLFDVYIRNGTVRYAAPNRSPDIFSTVGYRVTRASGENPAVRMEVPPAYHTLGLEMFLPARRSAFAFSSMSGTSARKFDRGGVLSCVLLCGG